MKCSVSGSSRVGVLFLSFCFITQSVPLFLIQKTYLVENIDISDNSFDGSRCQNDGDDYPFLYKNNEIGVGEITNDYLPFEKCAAFCRPYVDHKGYVGFATQSDYNRCSCFFDSGLLPDAGSLPVGVKTRGRDVNIAKGPVDGAMDPKGLGVGDKCYPYKVSLLCDQSMIDNRQSLYNIYSLFTYTVLFCK